MSLEPPLRIGMIARWRPPHLGHAAVLRALCCLAGEALIGVGSANRYNVRNPFTLDETLDMLRLILEDHDNFHLIPVPDLDDGPRWREMVMRLFGRLDLFVTANPYVAHLLGDNYRIIHPVELLSLNERIAIDGMGVRMAMARGDGWQALVPQRIADYISSRGLDIRFRQQFGLETLTLGTIL
ncbi:MAG: nicotinamide-nucleotide adenylyltransferase [Anaerolineales bacterium]